MREGPLPSSKRTISASLPSMMTAPVSGTLDRAIRPSSVDLPAPVGPTTAANVPEGIVRLTFRSGPNVTSRNSIEGGWLTPDKYSRRRHAFPTEVVVLTRRKHCSGGPPLQLL